MNIWQHYILLVGVIAVVCTSLKKDTMMDILRGSVHLFGVFTSVIVTFSVVVQLLVWLL